MTLSDLEPGFVMSHGDEPDPLTAYLCDALGWTEHGTSLPFAWLTDDGKRALDNLRSKINGETKGSP